MPGADDYEARVQHCRDLLAHVHDCLQTNPSLENITDAGARFDFSLCGPQSTLVHRCLDAEHGLVVELRLVDPKARRPDARRHAQPPEHGARATGVLVFHPAELASVRSFHHAGLFVPLVQRVLHLACTTFGILDCHLQLLPVRSLHAFMFQLFFADPDRYGPNDDPFTGACHSCDDTPLAARSRLFREDLVQSWIDAKGRPMLIVTPKRHVESAAELSAAELAAMYSHALALCDDAAPFVNMKLNFGCYRNWSHLHLKIGFSANAWAALLAAKLDDEQQVRAAQIAERRLLKAMEKAPS